MCKHLPWENDIQYCIIKVQKTWWYWYLEVCSSRSKQKFGWTTSWSSIRIFFRPRTLDLQLLFSQYFTGSFSSNKHFPGVIHTFFWLSWTGFFLDIFACRIPTIIRLNCTEGFNVFNIYIYTINIYWGLWYDNKFGETCFIYN